MPTTIGDLVLVHVNNAPAFFARIEGVEPDIKRDWWQVRLLVLQVPLRAVVWILRDRYVQGEAFTMDGTPIKLEKVVTPDAGPALPPEEPTPPEPSPGPEARGGERVISLAERRTKK